MRRFLFPIVIILNFYKSEKDSNMTQTQHSNQPNASSGRWTQQEHQQFIVGLQLYGRNWKKIQQILKTRTGSQIRSHAQKFFMKLGKSLDDKTNDGSNDQFLTTKEPYGNQLNFQLHSSFQVKSYFIDEISKAFQKLNEVNFWQTFIDRKLDSLDQLPSLNKKKSFTPFQAEVEEIFQGSIPSKKIKI